MEKDRPLISSAWISLVLSIVILAIKFFAYSQTGSAAVLSDALESIVNVMAAIVALVVLRIVSAPADEDHPYGHGKLEYFSSAFEGGLITFAALAIGYSALEAFLRGVPPRNIDIGLLLMILAAVINLLLGLHLMAVGKKRRSEALQASGAHVLSDVVTTGGVLSGLLLVKVTGLAWLDPLTALVVAGHLLYSGAKIVRKSIGGLLDETEDKTLAEIAEALKSHRISGLIDVHNLKVIRSGRFHHIDAHLVVPEFWDMKTTHEVAEAYEKAVVKSYPYDGEIAFHLDPCERLYCLSCDLNSCPVRLQQFKELRPFTFQTLTKGPRKDYSQHVTR
jgi:cation diffusion facilitator family transporter